MKRPWPKTLTGDVPTSERERQVGVETTYSDCKLHPGCAIVATVRACVVCLTPLSCQSGHQAYAFR